MASVPIIGLEPDELPWVRLLIRLLRHPDPFVAELARDALVYVDTRCREDDKAVSARI